MRHEDVEIESSYRADMIVEGRVILELKSIERVLPVHTAQTLTYLRLSDCEVALLLNFGAPGWWTASAVSSRNGIESLRPLRPSAALC